MHKSSTTNSKASNTGPSNHNNSNALFKTSAWMTPLRFGVVALGLHVISWIPWVQQEIILPYTAGVAAVGRTVLSFFFEGISGTGNLIGDSSFSILVLNVCNGTDILIFYAAAVICVSAPWRTRCLGLAAGLPFLAMLNIIRVVAIFLTGRFARDWFDFSHEFLWQALMILATAVNFGFYLKFSQSRGERI